MSVADQGQAQRAQMSAIEQQCATETKLRCDVITFYSGAMYHLYKYKKYTDVRLVFAPEFDAAFFGGDPDNFEYPRYDLDVCFFRVYENDKPARIQSYLKWSKNGPAKDELVFVSGHPGRTDRLDTVAELEYLRDHGFPYLLERLYRMEVMLMAYSGRSEENARRAKELLFGVQNSRKARDGGLAGLLDPRIMARKKQVEEALKEAVAKGTKLADVKSAWDKVAEAHKILAANVRPYSVI